MAMWRTGQRGYYTALAEAGALGGGWTVDRLIKRLRSERHAAYARGFLFYLYDMGLIGHEDADIVMWTIFQEHWLAGFPRSILAGYRPYGL